MASRTIDPARIEVVDEATAAKLRRMTPTEKIEMVFQCGRTFKCVLARHISMIHPDWSDEQVGREVVRRIPSTQDYEWRLASL
jgi:hypothetical protein